MDWKQFQRTKEDFTCMQCGHFVEGSGYTNHCPKCLYSRHVDVHPGDRAADCGGIMEPVAVTSKGGGHILTHTCVRCGFTRTNKVLDTDNFDAVVQLMRRIADTYR